MPRFTFNWAVGLQERISPAINKIRNAIESIRSKQVSVGVRSVVDSKVNVDTSSIGEAAGVLSRTRRSALSLAASFENIQRLKDIVPQEQFEALGKFLSAAEYPGIAEFIHSLHTLSRVSTVAAESVASDVENLKQKVISAFSDLVGVFSTTPLEKQKELWEKVINDLQKDFANVPDVIKDLKFEFPTEEEFSAFIEQFPQAFSTVMETLEKLPAEFTKIVEQLEKSYKTLEFEPVEAPEVSNVLEQLDVLREGLQTGLKSLMSMRDKLLRAFHVIQTLYMTQEVPADIMQFFETFLNQVDPAIRELHSATYAFDELSDTIQKSNEIVGIQGERYRVLLNTRFKPAREMMQQYGAALETVIQGLEMMSNRLKDTSAAMMSTIRWDPAAFIEQTGLAAFSTSSALDMLAYTHEELRHELNATREEANKLFIQLRKGDLGAEEYEKVASRFQELQLRMNSLGLQMKFLRYVMRWTAKYAEEYFPMGRDPVLFERMKRIDTMRQRMERFGTSMKKVAWLLTWTSLSLLGVFFSTQWFVNMTYGPVERYVKLLSNWADAAFDVAQWMAIASYIGFDISQLLGGQSIGDVINTIITGGMRAQATFAALTSVFAYFVAYALSKEDVWVAMRTAFEKFVTLLWENKDLIVGFIKGLFIGFGWILDVMRRLLDTMKTTIGVENTIRAFEILGIIIGAVAGAFMVLGPVLTFIMMCFQGLGSVILVVGTLLPELIGGFGLLLRVGLSILPVISSFAWLIPIIAGIAIVVYDAAQGFKWTRALLIDLLLILNQISEAARHFVDALTNAFTNPQKAAESFNKSMAATRELIQALSSPVEFGAFVARKLPTGKIPEWLFEQEMREWRETFDLKELAESSAKIRESIDVTSEELKDVPDTLDVMAQSLDKTFQEIKPTIRELTQMTVPKETLRMPTTVQPPSEMPKMPVYTERQLLEAQPQITMPTLPTITPPQTTYFYVTINAQNVTTESIPAIQEMLRKEYINLTNQTMLYKSR